MTQTQTQTKTRMESAEEKIASIGNGLVRIQVGHGRDHILSRLHRGLVRGLDLERKASMRKDGDGNGNTAAAMAGRIDLLPQTMRILPQTMIHTHGRSTGVAVVTVVDVDVVGKRRRKNTNATNIRIRIERRKARAAGRVGIAAMAMLLTHHRRHRRRRLLRTRKAAMPNLHVHVRGEV